MSGRTSTMTMTVGRFRPRATGSVAVVVVVVIVTDIGWVGPGLGELCWGFLFSIHRPGPVWSVGTCVVGAET